ncbi:hypothetical protein NBRC116588_21190 [Pyruvatibacter sp. HU-CL02332]
MQPEAPVRPARFVPLVAALAGLSAALSAGQPDPQQALPGTRQGLQAARAQQEPARQVPAVPFPEQKAREPTLQEQTVRARLAPCLRAPQACRHCRPHLQHLLPHHHRRQEWQPQCRRPLRRQQSLPPCQRLCRQTRLSSRT